MRALFIVQGEGRGHMTQALAIEQLLDEAGHQVVGIAIGCSSRREVPAYFKARTNATLHSIISPDFYYDKKSRSINLWKTGLFNFLAIPRFLNELRKVHALVKSTRPDVIINFYDLMGGAYFALFNPRVKRICIAHQYLALHPYFPFAPDRPLQKKLFQLTNLATALNSHQKIALSFSDYHTIQNGLTVAPPLLRKEIFELTPTKGNYLLAYVVNKGYAMDLMKWHNKNKSIPIHCFWDNREHGEEWSPRPGLTFHYINDRKFLKLMAGCMGYISTAGFESVCEAMYLEKPVMMVPVEHQYEQACNALDAVRAGAGITSDRFDPGALLSYLTTAKTDHEDFRKWVHCYSQVLLKEVESFVPDTKRRRARVRVSIPGLIISNR
jgi:uncharacterized protein (TIGR00661 family)